MKTLRVVIAVAALLTFGGAAQADATDCDIHTMTEPNCGDANGAGDWLPETPTVPAVTPDETPTEPTLATPAELPQIAAKPSGGIAAGSGSTATEYDEKGCEK